MISHTKLVIITYFVCWVLGLTISLLCGKYVISRVLRFIRNAVIKPKAYQASGGKEEYDKLYKDALYIQGGFIEFLERIFFLVAVAFNISGTLVAMIGWVTVKMVYNWGLLTKDSPSTTKRSLAFSALFGNLLSMFFALLGGLVCRIPSIIY